MEELVLRIYDLAIRIERINHWIKDNTEVTEPNMYEYTQILVEYGELLAEVDDYYRKNGYPDNIDPRGGHYEICYKVPELNEVNKGIRTLVSLRNLNERSEKSTHLFTGLKEARTFLTELERKVYAAEYKIPNNSAIRKIKKELLSKCMGISFYVWSNKRDDPEYMYNNKTEFESLQEMYDLYSKSEGHKYEGPQFGDIIENIIKYINKSYIYAEETEKNQKM